jgi:rhodanese-related sulfurtransferase
MNEITVTDLSTVSNPVIVDVREQSEYDEAHVSGVILIPLGQLEQRLAEVPAAEQVFVICAAGGRSLQAAALLAASGVPVVNVQGGTNAWQQAGLPVVSGGTR